MFLRDIMKELFTRSWWLCAIFYAFAPFLSAQHASPWFEVTWVQNVLQSKARTLSAASYWWQGKRLQLLLLLPSRRNEHCSDGHNRAGKQLLAEITFFLGKNAESGCFSQSANYSTCFKCKQEKNLQNMQPKCFILTSQMKHFDFLMLKSLASLDLPPFNFVGSKRWKLPVLS